MGNEIHQLESEDKNGKEEKGMVTIVVTIDEELLKRIEASVHPDSAAEELTKAEVGKEILLTIKL